MTATVQDREPGAPRVLRRSATGASRRIVFVVVALVMFGGQVLFLLPEVPDILPAALEILPVAASLALTGWFPGIGGALFSVGMALCLMFPASPTPPTLLPLGVYAIIADWVSRRWYLQAAAILVVVEGANAATSGTPEADLLGVVLALPLAVLAGLGLQWNRARIASLDRAAQSAREEAARTEASLRRDLVVDLHDTVATDLTRLTVLADTLRSPSTPRGTLAADDAATLDSLAALSRDALVHLRVLLDRANADPHASTPAPTSAPAPAPSTLADIVADARTILEGRGLSVETDVHAPDPAPSATLTPSQIAVASRVLREGAMNALKFSSAASIVRMSVDQHADALTLTLTNQVDPAPTPSADADTVISSGIGLPSLADKVEAIGGTIHYGAVNDMWVLSAFLPGSPPAAESHAP